MVYFRRSSTEEGHIQAGHGQGPHVAEVAMTINKNTPYYGLRDFKHLPPDQLK